MKRRIILVLGCAAVVCGVLLYLLTPYTVAPQPGYLEIHQVRRVGSNTEYIDITAQTDTEALGQLLASCKAAGRIDLFDESAFGQTLQRAVRALIGTDPQAWATGYVCTPSRFIRSPKSPFYPGSESLPEQECDQMIQGRNADGVWEITWSWGAYEREFAIAENWWKANLVIENLLFLRAFDCIETKR